MADPNAKPPPVATDEGHGNDQDDRCVARRADSNGSERSGPSPW